MSKLDNKIALVTGASRGIGRAIALRLGREGATVAVHYGRNREPAEEAVRDIVKSGGLAFALSADLGSPDGIHTLFAGLDEELQARFGGSSLDILVNNAGIGRCPD